MPKQISKPKVSPAPSAPRPTVIPAAINRKQTSREVAREAARVLRSEDASAIQKRLAASLLAQTNTKKETGAEMEEVAGAVLQSDKYSDLTKQLAASTVSQSNRDR